MLCKALASFYSSIILNQNICSVNRLIKHVFDFFVFSLSFPVCGGCCFTASCCLCSVVVNLFLIYIVCCCLNLQKNNINSPSLHFSSSLPYNLISAVLLFSVEMPQSAVFLPLEELTYAPGIPQQHYNLPTLTG